MKQFQQLNYRLASLISLVGVLLFAYLGYFNRYWADDWCYNADLQSLGFGGTLKGYTYITTYASNRFSLTLFSGMFYPLGIFGVQIMTTLVIGTWLLGLYLLISNLVKITAIPLNKFHAFLISTTVTYYSIYLTPHLYQSFYWRSGLLPYTAPTIFSIWVFVLITHQATQKNTSQWTIAFTSLLAFLAGGFSEAGCATLVAALITYIFACLIFKTNTWAKDSLSIAVEALLSALLAMAVLILAPTNTYRIGLYGEPISIAEFPTRLIFLTYEYIKHSFVDAPYPYIVIATEFVSLGYLLIPAQSEHFSKKGWGIVFLVVATLTFLLVAATYAPSAYIEKVPPAPRTRVISNFILIFGLGTLCFLVGYFLKQKSDDHRVVFFFVMILLLVNIYTARTVLITSQKIDVYAERAATWDERDEQIKTAQETGSKEVDVRGIDGTPVNGIRDFKDKPGVGFWINQCAARFYGMDAIYATLP